MGWFTHIHGHIFIDSNGNGRRDPGENSVPQFPVTVRERDNSLMDQAVNPTSTDSNGAYDIREAYPLGKWLVLEAFDTRYQTTGITYKGENENNWTTKPGSLVDVNFLPIIGQGIDAVGLAHAERQARVERRGAAAPTARSSSIPTRRTASTRTTGRAIARRRPRTPASTSAAMSKRSLYPLLPRARISRSSLA